MLQRRVDPEGNEARSLDKLVDLRAARVLEIGSGDGRLTAFYAPRAEQVFGIDIKVEAQVAELRAQRPSNFQFALANAQLIPCRPESFDVVFFSRSL